MVYLFASANRIGEAIGLRIKLINIGRATFPVLAGVARAIVGAQSSLVESRAPRLWWVELCFEGEKRRGKTLQRTRLKRSPMGSVGVWVCTKGSALMLWYLFLYGTKGGGGNFFLSFRLCGHFWSFMSFTILLRFNEEADS